MEPHERLEHDRSGSGGQRERHAKRARPPLRPRTVGLVWSMCAATLAILVLGGLGAPGPLDDPDPARQRPGLLVDAAEARVVSDLALPGDPLADRPVLLIFDRDGPRAAPLAAVLAKLPERFAVVLVVPDAPRDAAERPGDDLVAPDPTGRIRRAVGLTTPEDGGFPTGYAVIDAERRVRYATLDPAYGEHAFEVEIIAKAL